MGVVPTERSSCRRDSVRGWSAHAIDSPNGDSGRRTTRSSRPLRAQDRWHFGAFVCGALAAAELHRWAGRRRNVASGMGRADIVMDAGSLGSHELAATAWGVEVRAASLGRFKRAAFACGTCADAWGAFSHAWSLGRFSLAASAWGAVSDAWGVDAHAWSVGQLRLAAHASAQRIGKGSGRL